MDRDCDGFSITLAIINCTIQQYIRLDITLAFMKLSNA